MTRSAASYADERPRDFTARLPRKARGIGSRRKAKHRGRKLAALAVAFAVPAFAAPSDWHGMPTFEKAQPASITPMGFEVAGESFPGSAFYYLADEPYLPPDADTPVHADRIGGPTQDFADPAARPMALGGTTLDKSRALQCMTMAIYYEAASESDAGQRAVAQVVLNRVAHPAYPNSVCGVVFQGAERQTGCQFSFTCDGSLARKPSRRFWDRAQGVATAALAGAVYRPVGLATHYHTVQVHPYWAGSLTQVGTIGAHRFYRWKGTAGQPAAFSASYSAHEPPPSPIPGRNTGETQQADPVELALLHEAALGSSRAASPVTHGKSSAPMTSSPSFKPAYSAEIEARGGDALFAGNRLPGAGQVKPEFSQSGQWIVKP